MDLTHITVKVSGKKHSNGTLDLAPSRMVESVNHSIVDEKVEIYAGEGDISPHTTADMPGSFPNKVVNIEFTNE